MRISFLLHAVRAGFLWCVLAGAAATQEEPVAVSSRILPASPLLSPDHWATQAAQRLEALGLVPEYLPAASAVPREGVRYALETAAERAPEQAPELADLAAALLNRFHEEFPATGGGEREPYPVLLGGSSRVGYIARSGFLSPTKGFGVPPIGIEAVPAERDARFRATVAGRWGAHLAILAEPELRIATEPELGRAEFEWWGWDAIAGWGPVALAVGRQPVGYASAQQGGLVLSPTLLERVQLQTVRPITLPGWLSRLGPLAVDAFISRLSENRHLGDPFFFWDASCGSSASSAHGECSASFDVRGGQRVGSDDATQCWPHVVGAVRGNLHL